MSSEALSPELAWRRLRRGSKEAQGISIPTIAADTKTLEGAVRHALGSHGEARLLVPVGMHERIKTLGESPALRVSESTYHQDGRPVRFIDLTCTVSELDSVFAEVGEELMKRIREGSPAQDSVRSTLSDFRALLVDAPSKQIGDAGITGLVGELLVLCRLLNFNQAAAEAWRGPGGERHDFRRAGHALEVKTTSRKSDLTVEVSAIDQLVPPNGGTLHLAHVILERDAHGPLNVEGLARKALDMASDSSAITKLLGLLGCNDPGDENWNRLRFSEEEVTFYGVIEGFPRIVPGTFSAGYLPTGVTKLKYTIDLAQATSFALSKKVVDELLRRIAG